MEITFIGQAGLFIETQHGSVLCDPWFNPAYFASWYPFPDNDGVDLEKIARPTYLYVSHLHYDHFDPDFLRDHVWKEATVLLPDYPLPLMERAMRELGFTKFIQTKNGEAVDVDGLRFMILAMTAPNDGVIGDSSLMVDDGEFRILDQNDSRPLSLDVLNKFAPYDAHFLQYSGASWYPMVYQFPQKMMQALSRKKRENEMARALRYAQEIGASYVIPSAGPPCFLDDAMFDFNDFDRDPTNIFPDQTVFLDYMRDHGFENGCLLIPGSVAILGKDRCIVKHPMTNSQVENIFKEKRAYLEAYKARKQPLIDTIKASWHRGQVDILSSLRDWFEPLLEQADLICAGVNGRVLLDCEVQQIMIDFQQRRVYQWQGEEWLYCFQIEPALIETCIVQHEEDWVNQIFLSCRFKVERKGPYNEYLYNFFRCLSPERLQYAESYYRQQASPQQLWESNGYRIQRYCPHMRSDLTRFADIDSENGILTCRLHGWQFELATGRCLTAEGYKLYTEPLSEEKITSVSISELESPVGSEENKDDKDRVAEFIRNRCGHCWYVPSDLPATIQKAR